MREVWEERFERTDGFWGILADTPADACLDCGLLKNGFARVRCGTSRGEFLIASACKGRGLSPLCAAQRSAALAAFLRGEGLIEVGHAQWVFSIPKMLRPYFLSHRSLLGGPAY